MNIFQGKSIFDLFVAETNKSRIFTTSEVLVGIFKRFLIFFLIFCWIPILFYVLSGKLSTKYFLDFTEKFKAELEFVETSKLGSSSVIPGVNIPSFGGVIESTGNDDLLSRIVKSDEVMKKALFSKTELDTTVIINEIVKEFFPDSNVSFPNVKSSSEFDLETLSPLQKKVYRGVRNYLGNPKNEFYLYEAGETRKITVISPNENLSLSLPTAIFSALEDFYEIRKESDKELTNDLLVQKKRQALIDYRRLQNELTESNKKHGLTISPARQLYEKELKGKIALAQQSYTQATKQLEEVKVITKKNYEPRFKLLAKPIFPLSPVVADNDKTLLIHKVVGTVLGFIIVIFLFIIYQLIIFYRNKPE